MPLEGCLHKEPLPGTEYVWLLLEMLWRCRAGDRKGSTGLRLVGVRADANPAWVRGVRRCRQAPGCGEQLKPPVPGPSLHLPAAPSPAPGRATRLLSRGTDCRLEKLPEQRPRCSQLGSTLAHPCWDPRVQAEQPVGAWGRSQGGCRRVWGCTTTP